MRIRAAFTDHEFARGMLRAVRRSEDNPTCIELAIDYSAFDVAADPPHRGLALANTPTVDAYAVIELSETDAEWILRTMRAREHLKTLAETEDAVARFLGRPAKPRKLKP